MTTPVGRVYSRARKKRTWSEMFLPASDGRLLFVDHRQRLRERIGNGLLVLAWGAAVGALIGASWFAL
jgi:hypothetical protein